MSKPRFDSDFLKVVTYSWKFAFWVIRWCILFIFIIILLFIYYHFSALRLAAAIFYDFGLSALAGRPMDSRSVVRPCVRSCATRYLEIRASDFDDFLRKATSWWLKNCSKRVFWKILVCPPGGIYPPKMPPRKGTRIFCTYDWCQIIERNNI